MDEKTAYNVAANNLMVKYRGAMQAVNALPDSKQNYKMLKEKMPLQTASVYLKNATQAQLKLNKFINFLAITKFELWKEDGADS